MAGQHAAPSSSTPTVRLVMLACGTVLALATMAAWLWGATHEVDTSPLFAFVVPIVGALFLADRISDAGDAAKQAAHQTNGNLEARVQSAVASALANRDTARTHQSRLDTAEAAALAEASGAEGASYAPSTPAPDYDATEAGGG